MASTPAVSRLRRNIVVGAALLAIVLSSLDNLIIGVAMPAIVGELGGLDRLPWVVTAYTIALAISTPLWGKLGDMYGRKGAMLTSIAIFLLGSALCGVAQDIWQLIGFRGLQGLGAGGLMVGAQAIMGTIIPPREQGKYQGLGAAAIGAATVAGPVVGGVITEHWGWRWAFYINIPLGLLAIVVLVLALKLPKQPAPSRIDYPGAALLVVAISAIILVTSWGGTEYAWTSPTVLALIALAVAALAAFLAVERRAANPVLPLSIFANRSFALVTAIGFLLGFVMFAGMTYLPVYLQAVQGTSPSDSGVLLLPLVLTMIATGAVVGSMMSKTGKYKIFIVGGAASVLLGSLLLSRLGADTPTALTVAGMVVFGFGIGSMLQITVLVSIQSVSAENLGAGAGTATLIRTLGGSIGVAVMGALFTAQLNSVRGIEVEGGGEGAAHIGPEQLKEMSAAVRASYEEAAATGTSHIFLAGTGVATAALVLALCLREVPLRETSIADELAEREEREAREERDPHDEHAYQRTAEPTGHTAHTEHQQTPDHDPHHDHDPERERERRDARG